MRGAYPVPGGGVVAVEVDLDGDHLAGVRFSGDFSLEPAGAIGRLTGALVGAPSSAGARELAARLEQAIAGHASLVGTTPGALAIAVRRALGGATDWADHTFEVVHEGPASPWLHMALDEVLTESVGAGARGPTLRIWEWERPSVVIGSFQSLRNEVDQEGAARHGITVVRRISGGGAMFVEPGKTITYSLTVPGSLVAGLSFEASYAFLDDWVLGALAQLGVRARYVPLNDVASPVGKIAGAAQKRLASGAVLHHVTMAYDIDSTRMLEVLRIGRARLSAKGTASAAKRVDPLRRQTALTRAEVVESFKAYFRGRYTCVDGFVTDAERARAGQLAEAKFATPEWTARVP